MSRTTDLALLVNCIISPAYWTVVELSSVDRIGIHFLSRDQIFSVRQSKSDSKMG